MCIAALQKEEVEERYLGCGWKVGVRDRDRVGSAFPFGS